MIFIKFSFVFFCVLFAAESAKILGIFHIPSTSHFILGSSLLKALAKRGHEVTMLSPFKLKEPVKNYEEIELTGMLQFKEETMFDATLNSANVSAVKRISIMVNLLDKVNDHFFNNPSLKTLLSSNRTFDLVIQSWFGNEAYFAIAHHFGASTVAFSTIGSSVLSDSITKNPSPYSYVPNMMASLSDNMNFFERVKNTLIGIGADMFGIYSTTKEEKIKQKYFPNAPPTKELVKNISLLLLNTHFSIESPRPYVPSMIQVGGLHVEDPKPLDNDLKSFMDSAKDGVIFFSLGSNVRSSDLDEHKLNGIIKCFSKLSLKILWKFENTTIEGMPSNVKISKWLPQRDILAHPNTKLFISHGGLLSTIEAVYSGVPIVGIPIFGDQETNVDDSVRRGHAYKIPLLELSEETLTKAINEVLNNPKYRDNIKKISSILQDQPLKPIDKAVYWVEYVLRHNGAHHLKTAALKLNWYELLLLDVTAFLLITIVIAISIIYYIIKLSVRSIKYVVHKITSNSSLKVSAKKKKLKKA